MNSALRLLCPPVLACFVFACAEEAPRETGDLPALRELGQLRVLVPRLGTDDVLPRHGHPLRFERELAAQLAERLELEPVWVPVARRDALVPALVEGRGDLIAANLTVTPERRERIAFSEPLGHVREQLITRVGDADVREPADLVGREIVVRRSSSFWPTVERLRDRQPGIELVAAPEGMDTEEILYRVSTGEFDMTVADDNLAEQVLAYLPGLHVALDLTGPRPVAWGLRPDAPLLSEAVNRFILDVRPAEQRPERYRTDLAGIRSRKVLRVLTRNSASTYFIWRGDLVGFEYDLAKRFADRIGVHLEIVVAPTRAALLTWLRQGRGDLAAAGLTITPEREARGIAFSRPYHYVRETVVARPADSLLSGPGDLAGRTIAVRRSSSYWDTLRRLQERGIEFELVAAPESLETENIIARVADGAYDLTVADSHILAIELSWRDDIIAAFPLGDSLPHGWAVRAADRELKAAVDRYFEREYRGLFYNVTRNKYFRTRARIGEQAADRPARSGRITPYDDVIRRYADRYGFDWRLIAAQMYQESRFEPNARSFAGAVGLMQVLPSTARELGIDAPERPEDGVHAGVQYLRSIYDRLEDARSPRDRLWLALAAYNAGPGHLHDARRLARRLDRDPTVWFGELERVMPLLARSEYHRRARYGYCRCSEPVRYVRAIRDRYRAYRAAVGGETTAP